MVPSIFVRLEKFPLTPNAKLDRKALPRPEGKRPVLAQDFIAPRTEVEKQLAHLWCDLLQLEEVGIDDSFFDLGGNSLAAVRMVSHYHTRFGREIPPVKVFQYPTIAKLASFLEESDAQPDFLGEAETRARHQRHERERRCSRCRAGRHDRAFSRRRQSRSTLAQPLQFRRIHFLFYTGGTGAWY